MPVSVECQSCGRKLSVPEKHIGKKAKCPGCGEHTWLRRTVEEPNQFEDQEDDPYDSYGALPPLPKTKPKPMRDVLEVETLRQKSRRKPSVPASALTNLFVGIVCIAFGYFLGREHLKHQLASAFSQAAESFAAGLKSGLEEKPAAPNQAVEPPKKPSSVSEASKPPAEPQPVAPLIPEMKIGEPYRTDTFEVVLQSASVGPVPLKEGFGGGVGESENPQLMFKFMLRNVHERKILTFRGEPSFGSQRFILKDDVDNRIRGVNFGFSNEVVGELRSADDLLPGEAKTHVQVFTVPPEKTQSLTLSVDCQAFDSEGTIKFVIPASQITGFNK